MQLHLEDKLTLVSASSGGIGLEIARALAREGARVIINGRSAQNVDAAIANIHAGQPEAKLERLVANNGGADGTEQTIRAYPDVDILINNLGIYACASASEPAKDGRSLNPTYPIRVKP